MATTVWLAASALEADRLGGHRWVYLNWALGLRDAGCDVIWLEQTKAWPDPDEAIRRHRLAADLHDAGLDVPIVLYDETGRCLHHDDGAPQIGGADLLLSIDARLDPATVRRFRRTALVDIDPGLLQYWVARGEVTLASYDRYFTTGETVGTPAARFPMAGVDWVYTPPAVHLPSWPVTRADHDAPYTTVSNYWGNEWIEVDGRYLDNSKGAAFRRVLALPPLVPVDVEVAFFLGSPDAAPSRLFAEHGWRVVDAPDVSATPAAYRAYVQGSRAEFSCVKRSCVEFQNAWISDRTLCYLASGKPAVVEHTGPSRTLPDRAGLLRFRTLEEAAACIRAAEADYEEHARLAREVARTFDAERVVRRLLDVALD